MEVIPAINCADQESFRKRIEQAKLFVPLNGWLHVDVSDKDTTGMESFFNASVVREYLGHFQFEIHAMVAKEKLLSDEWFLGERTRLLVHWSSINDALLKRAREQKTQIGAVIYFNENPQAVSLPEGISYVEVLSVPAGPSGGTFQELALEIILFLKERHPNVTISVDGGVREEVAELVKERGVDVVVSGSYIWGSPNPAQAYERLKKI